MESDPQHDAKRVLTDEVHASDVASDAPMTPTMVDPELAQQLRNVAMRARRNVSQGYLTTIMDPQQRNSTHTPFTKALSTNTIFRSSSDVLHDVYGASVAEGPRSFPAREQMASSKRARSEERDTESTAFSRSADPTGIHSDSTALSESSIEHRSIRPLRRSGMTGPTRSLPATAWTARSSGEENAVAEEEEDWSLDTGNGSKTFEPMVLS